MSSGQMTPRLSSLRATILHSNCLPCYNDLKVIIKSRLGGCGCGNACSVAEQLLRPADKINKRPTLRVEGWTNSLEAERVVSVGAGVNPPRRLICWSRFDRFLLAMSQTKIMRVVRIVLRGAHPQRHQINTYVYI